MTRCSSRNHDCIARLCHDHAFGRTAKAEAQHFGQPVTSVIAMNIVEEPCLLRSPKVVVVKVHSGDECVEQVAASRKPEMTAPLIRGPFQLEFEPLKVLPYDKLI